MSWTSGIEEIVVEQAPLAERTWLGIGGPADYLAQPTTHDQLTTLVSRCREHDLPIRLLGGGSNVMVRDGGVRGVVLNLVAECFTGIQIQGNTVTCGGGAKLAHVISETVGAGLAGLEPMIGIPGTIGGALHGNAGSHGGDIGQWTSHATVLTRGGKLVERDRADMVFAYRQSSLDELVIVEARFELETEDPHTLAKRMQKGWIATKASQPVSHERAVCLFKDHQGMSAEMLIDQAGLKGSAVGGAELSNRHANFLVAHAGATTADVLTLIDLLKTGVNERLGVELTLQLEIW
jgi:UDP-N-acetylmuramate dehydrogenase